jgi:hypothetical protein
MGSSCSSSSSSSIQVLQHPRVDAYSQTSFREADSKCLCAPPPPVPPLRLVSIRPFPHNSSPVFVSLQRRRCAYKPVLLSASVRKDASPFLSSSSSTPSTPRSGDSLLVASSPSCPLDSRRQLSRHSQPLPRDAKKTAAMTSSAPVTPQVSSRVRKCKLDSMPDLSLLLASHMPPGVVTCDIQTKSRI